MKKEFVIAIFLGLATFIFTGSADSMNGIMEQDCGGYFLVEDCWDLQAIPEYGLDQNFRLANDIDCSDTINWNDGQGFEPIGDWNNHFTGHFDGNNHVIEKLFIDRPFLSPIGCVALFRVIGDNGIVQNVGLTDVDINGGQSFATSLAGAVAGDNRGTISNCYSTGTVNNYHHVGGLVGDNSGVIVNCHSSVTVSGYPTELYQGGSGGLAGFNVGSIAKCFSTGVVNGTSEVGGVVGLNFLGGSIIDSYSTAVVNGVVDVGGLSGGNGIESSISNCYSIGSVNGEVSVGGLVGNIHDGSSITNCYSVGEVIGGIGVGGLLGNIGPNGSWCSGCLWDIETSGQSSSACGTGKTTTEMMNEDTFTNAGWNFDSIWSIVENETYPRFQLEYPIEIKVAINEIMYNPASWQGSDYYNEYVELYNYGSKPVDAGKLLIGDLVENDELYSYEEGGTTIIPPGGYAIITDSTTDVYDTFDVASDAIRLRVADDAIGKGLNNSGDLVLLSIDGAPIERVTYNDTIAWHKYDAAGYGASLQRLDPQAPVQNPCNWCGIDLSPGRRNTSCSVASEIDIKPETLNLKSKGKWITCYIELPADYDIGSINIDTVSVIGVNGVLLNPVISATGPSEIGDYDSDGIPDLMVKFDRAEVQAVVEVGEEGLIVAGKLDDGTPFEGSDTVGVIERGK